jgi:hypothetical protein
MPTISRFFGIKIQIRFREHNPPHFHAVYGEYSGVFDIHTLGMTEGVLPSKAQALVVEWSVMHRAELLTAWEQACSGQTPNQIEPLA